MEHIIIRKAQKKDFDYIVRLTGKLQDYLRAFNATYKTSRVHRPAALKHTRKALARRNYLVLVVEHADRVVGFCLGLITKPYNVYLPERIGFIYDIYLEPQFRRRRIAQRMLAVQHSWMKKRSVRFVELYVDPKNPAGMGAWKKYGFKPLLIRMRKDLKK